jgi:microcystin synthetase protein McyB
MQSILPDGHQIGELYVSGRTVFPGYLNRHDLTRRVIISGLSNEHQYYKTGDLVRLDSRGRLYYVGRRDYMVKLRGQRIELTEIEQTIADTSPHVAKCVVVKQENSITGHEALVAFVQTTATNIEELLRQKCQQRLPPYMVPSIFILLDTLPLSENGKVDRKRLPLPDIHITHLLQHEGDQPNTEMERHVAAIWCEILRLNSNLSTAVSFFKLGGISLLLMKLYHSYQKLAQFDSNTLKITQLFRQPTIVDHARLLQAHQQTNSAPAWQSLNIVEGKES